MRKNVVVLGVVLALVAVPAFAAIEYEFSQKTTTEDPLVPTTDLTARAIIDGARTRVEFRSAGAWRHPLSIDFTGQRVMDSAVELQVVPPQ